MLQFDKEKFSAMDEFEMKKVYDYFHDKKLWLAKQKIIGLRMLMARKEMRLNMVPMSHFIDVGSHCQIHRFETGKCSPSAVDVIQYSEFTGRPISFFFEP